MKAIIRIFIFFCMSMICQTVSAQNKISCNHIYDMGALQWRLFGYRPEVWRMDFDLINNKSNGKADISGIVANVPGSVQKALLDNGLIEDWNYGRNAEKIEWIEHRNWVFSTEIPDNWIDMGKLTNIQFHGLDDNGTVFLNGKLVGNFDNTFVPYTFNVTELLKEHNNVLTVVFDLPPRYLGQIGFTSKIKDWKPRFYYGWDWMPRIVQIGIWDKVLLEVRDKEDIHIKDISVITTADRSKDSGELRISSDLTVSAKKEYVRIELKDKDNRYLIDETYPAAEVVQGKTYKNLEIRRWYPNGAGNQPLYDLIYTLMDENGNIYETDSRKIGFKSVVWEPNSSAPEEADSWICVVNDMPVFLQGINWTPIRPNFADLTKDQYAKLLQDYKDMGFNMIRIWGGGFPEKDWLYDLCDELGLLIHQDFPLSSSGLDNYPPETSDEICVMADIVRHYLSRNKHHVSMLIWSGGNELYKRGDTGPITLDHPMIRCQADIVASEDPFNRFIPASPTGINIEANRNNFGSGKNWDTHGPWTLPYDRTNHDYSIGAINEYWKTNDALFISEMGAPGAMSAEMINKYKGEFDAMPASYDNPYWNQFNWWIEWNQYLFEHDNMSPSSLEEYVAWSQQNQINGLTSALRNMKNKFPECGGLIIWMGHDSFPAPANTSIIDFDGNWKPVAYELQKILIEPVWK